MMKYKKYKTQSITRAQYELMRLGRKRKKRKRKRHCNKRVRIRTRFSCYTTKYETFEQFCDNFNFAELSYFYTKCDLFYAFSAGSVLVITVLSAGQV